MRSILLLPLVARCLETIDVCIKKIVLFIHITLDTGTNFDLLYQSMRTDIKILGLSLYMSRTMFVTILSSVDSTPTMK